MRVPARAASHHGASCRGAVWVGANDREWLFLVLPGSRCSAGARGHYRPSARMNASNRCSANIESKSDWRRCARTEGIIDWLLVLPAGQIVKVVVEVGKKAAAGIVGWRDGAETEQAIVENWQRTANIALSGIGRRKLEIQVQYPA